MLDLIAILLCLWLQAPVICPKSKKVDAVDKQPLNGFNRRLQNSHLPSRAEVTWLTTHMLRPTPQGSKPLFEAANQRPEFDILAA